jgi:hypothetical protein
LKAVQCLKIFCLNSIYFNGGRFMKKSMTIVVIGLILGLAGSAIASLDRYYQFETETGGITPDSVSGVSGTLNGYSGYPGSGSGIVADSGGAALHNGRVKKAEHVMECIPYGGMFSTYSGFTGSNDTVALWFKTDGQWVPGVDNWNELFSCNAEYNLEVGGNDETGPMAAGYILSWSWTGSVDTSKVTTAPLAYDDGDWHYLVRTFSPYSPFDDATKIYIDGLLVASGPVPGSAPGASNALQVGMASTTGWASYFKGRIDNVRCYSNALTADEVWAVYVSETDTCVSVKQSQGDLNGDCAINFNDVAIMAANWLHAG